MTFLPWLGVKRRLARLGTLYELKAFWYDRCCQGRSRVGRPPQELARATAQRVLDCIVKGCHSDPFRLEELYIPLPQAENTSQFEMQMRISLFLDHWNEGRRCMLLGGPKSDQRYLPSWLQDYVNFRSASHTFVNRMLSTVLIPNTAT